MGKVHPLLYLGRNSLHQPQSALPHLSSPTQPTTAQHPSLCDPMPMAGRDPSARDLVRDLLSTYTFLSPVRSLEQRSRRARMGARGQAGIIHTALEDRTLLQHFAAYTNDRIGYKKGRQRKADLPILHCCTSPHTHMLQCHPLLLRTSLAFQAHAVLPLCGVALIIHSTNDTRHACIF